MYYCKNSQNSLVFRHPTISCIEDFFRPTASLSNFDELSTQQSAIDNLLGLLIRYYTTIPAFQIYMLELLVRSNSDVLSSGTLQQAMEQRFGNCHLNVIVHSCSLNANKNLHVQGARKRVVIFIDRSKKEQAALHLILSSLKQ